MIHDTENKSHQLTAALDALKAKNHVFKPVGLTNPELLFGHGQTLLTEIKDDLINLGPFNAQFLFTYTRREIFTLSDGALIAIDFKFKSDEDKFGGLGVPLPKDKKDEKFKWPLDLENLKKFGINEIPEP